MRRFRIREERPVTLGVGWNDGRFEWRERPADESLSSWYDSSAHLRREALRDGYVSEWCDSLRAALQAFKGSMEEGVAIFLDYGYAHAEYYHPERMDGTLTCHFAHRAHADPLTLVGLQDLTASVDFTAVAIAALVTRTSLSS